MSTRRFHRLFDDAAVFPPGLASVEAAVTDFRSRATGEYAELIGPLLIGTGGVGELISLLSGGSVSTDPVSTDPVPVTLIARPGTPLPDLAEAVQQVRRHLPEVVALRGVEVAHSTDWRAALTWDLPVAVEVDRSPAHLEAHLNDIAEAATAGAEVRAKLRTQSTPQGGLPTVEELAAFILGCVRRDLPFKLTGGLHHAVPTDVVTATGAVERQHGLLNVLLATHQAIAALPSATHQAIASLPSATVTDLLRLQDSDSLVRQLRDLTQDQVRDLRALFTSYGCCGVLDPIGELTALHLLPEPTDDKDD